MTFFFQLLATKTAKHGPGQRSESAPESVPGVAARKLQPSVPWLAAAASHAAMHTPFAQPWSGGHAWTTLPWPSTTFCRSPEQPPPFPPPVPLGPPTKPPVPAGPEPAEAPPEPEAIESDPAAHPATRAHEPRTKRAAG